MIAPGGRPSGRSNPPEKLPECSGGRPDQDGKGQDSQVAAGEPHQDKGQDPDRHQTFDRFELPGEVPNRPGQDKAPDSPDGIVDPARGERQTQAWKCSIQKPLKKSSLRKNSEALIQVPESKMAKNAFTESSFDSPQR
jgi:hypothetical protein